MKIPCFGIHDYQVISFFNYNDTSYNERAPSHSITFMCKKCKKIKQVTNYFGGFLDSDFKEIYNDKSEID